MINPDHPYSVLYFLFQLVLSEHLVLTIGPCTHASSPEPDSPPQAAGSTDRSSPCGHVFSWSWLDWPEFFKIKKPNRISAVLRAFAGFPLIHDLFPSWAADFGLHALSLSCCWGPTTVNGHVELLIVRDRVFPSFFCPFVACHSFLASSWKQSLVLRAIAGV